MEKSMKLKAATSAMGAALLVSGAVAAVPGAAIAQDAAATDAQAKFSQNAAELGLSDQVCMAQAAQKVEGVFSFSQDAVTCNQDIASIFQKAAATLCQTMPDYDAMAAPEAIEVSGPQASFAATVEGLGDEGAAGAIMGCACATNVPGGGAIANAEVQGVALAAIAAIAQAI